MKAHCASETVLFQKKKHKNTHTKNTKKIPKKYKKTPYFFSRLRAEKNSFKKSFQKK